MLYICATPIGNLSDISLRALEVLRSADIILCEDTRMSKRLLQHHDITYKKLIALHEHNENEVADKVITWLEENQTIVQISDAGTPGVSDPGSRLCNMVLAHGQKVSPIPGACAYISLLSVAGLNGPSLFYGFLPNKSSARCSILNQWKVVDYAICLYEAPHRILECVEDIVKCLGEERIIVMGRELTKQFETIKKTTASELLIFIKSDTNQERGEFVLLIAPVVKAADVEMLTIEQINALSILLPELPPKKAVAIAHKLTGANKDLLYNYAVDNK